MPTATALVVVWGHFLLALGLSVGYFRRYAMPAPPLGVLNLSDIALALVAITAVPYLHTRGPGWASALLLAGVMGGLYFLLLEPVVAGRRARVTAVGALVGFGLVAPSLDFVHPQLATVINNGLIVLAVVAIANVWVQSGLSVRNLTLLAMAVAVYDFVFTGRMPLTADMFARLDRRAFEPLIAWRDGPVWPAVGLGDTIMAAAFTLVVYKAWGARAATAGGVAVVVALAAAFLRPLTGILFQGDAYPAMVLIGPAQVATYLLLTRRLGPERTMAQVRGVRAAPSPAPPAHDRME